MYCKECCKELEKGWKFCPNCKLLLSSNNVEYDIQKVIKKKKLDKQGQLICIIVYFVGLFGICCFSNYSLLFLFFCLVSIVTGYIKYPRNLFIKIMFWAFIIIIIVLVIYALFLAVTCSNEISRYRCPGER